MTYCLGILLNDGVVMAADSRTNAGVDHISTFRKLNVFEKPGERVIALATAGNLATSQAVVSLVSERLGDPHGENGILAADSMFAVARIVGSTLRQVIEEHGEAVREDGGDPRATFILGGQIESRSPRLFLIYAAGNFIEATHETPFLQIGENKYGKPILDRTVNFDMPMDRAGESGAGVVRFDHAKQSVGGSAHRPDHHSGRQTARRTPCRHRGGRSVFRGAPETIRRRHRLGLRRSA